MGVKEVNKKYKLSIILAFIVASCILIYNISLNANSEPFTVYEEDGFLYSKHAYMLIDDWNSLDLSNDAYESAEEMLLEVDNYVDDISKLININWPDEIMQLNDENFEARIRIKFTFGISTAYGGGASRDSTNIRPRIILNRSLVESRKVPMAHEITHILSPFSQSSTFNEGLACYIQDNIGLNPGPPTNGISDETSSKYIDSEYSPLIDFIGSPDSSRNKIWTRVGEERVILYSFSESFTNYVIDEYGKKKYMELYSSNFSDEIYNSIFGQARSDLIDGWIQTLQ